MVKITLYVLGAIILLWLLYRVIYLQMKKQEYQKAFLEVFSNIEFQRPLLEAKNSYGYQSFDVIFEREEDFELAKRAKTTEEFEKRIQEIYKDIQGFEVNRAVHFTWKGRTYSDMISLGS